MIYMGVSKQTRCEKLWVFVSQKGRDFCGQTIKGNSRDPQ